MEGEDSFVLFFLKGSEKWLANFSIVFFGKKSLILFFDELIYSLLLTSIVKKKKFKRRSYFSDREGKENFFSCSNLKYKVLQVCFEIKKKTFLRSEHSNLFTL